MKNQRMSRRVQVNFPVLLEMDGERIEGSARELGEGGMRFECSCELGSPSVGLFTLHTSTEVSSITLKGEVLYMYPPRAGSDIRQYGVRFVSLDAGEKESLANLLRVFTLRDRYAPKRKDIIKDG